MDNSNSRYPAAPSVPIDTVCIQCALDAVPRATLADRENRELGIEPPPELCRHGRTRALCVGDGIDCERAHGLVQDARTLPAFASLGKRCKACGGGAAYLEQRPDLDYCTPQCAAYGSGRAPAKRISSVMDIPLNVRAKVATALLERATVPTLPEDRAASEMFDDDERDGDDLAAYVSELEADVRRAERHAQTLQAQLDAANARIAELEKR